MSYILDALQRADQERSLGEVPKLDTALQPSLVAKKSSWLPTAVIILCLASLIAGAIWLVEQGFFKRDSTRPMAEATESAPIARSAPAPVRAAAPVATNTTAQPKAIEPAPQAPTAQNLAQAAPVPAEPARLTEPTTTTPAPPPRSAPAETPEPAAEKRSARLPTPTVAPAPPPSWVNEEKQTQRREREQASATLTSYLGMPQSFRSGLPALNMNAHVFSTNPGRSFVLINNKRYRIGDYLAEGPEVTDILPDGAVLKHRGETFLLPVQR